MKSKRLAKQTRNNQRLSVRQRARGLGCAELACSCFVLMIVTMLMLDICYVVIGWSKNAHACRDAARVAAQSDNVTDALKASQTAVASHAGDGYWFTSPVVDTNRFIYEDYGGAALPGSPPYVSVVTNATVRFPAPIVFLNAKFGNGGTMTITHKCVFPIVRMKLYL